MKTRVSSLHTMLTYSVAPTLSYMHPDASELGVHHVPSTDAHRDFCRDVQAWLVSQLTPRTYAIGDTETTHAAILHWFIIRVDDDGEHQVEAIVGYEGLNFNESVYVTLPEKHHARARRLHHATRRRLRLGPVESQKAEKS